MILDRILRSGMQIFPVTARELVELWGDPRWMRLARHRLGQGNAYVGTVAGVDVFLLD